MSIKFEIEGENVNLFRRFSWRRAATAWAEEVGPVVAEAIRVKAPVSQGPGGGKLRESITFRHRAGFSTVGLEFGSDVPYAAYVEGGTSPHVIMPRNARALHWLNNGGGDVYSMMVNHPGSRPNPYARNAVRSMVPYMERRFSEVVQSEFRRL